MSVVGRACFRRSAVAVPSVRPGLLRLCITAAPLHRQTSCKSTVNADGLTSADPFGVVTPDRAFLPSADPLQRLEGPGLELWEGLVDDVPKLAVAGGGLLRSAVLGLPPFPDVGATSSATAPGPSDARQAAGSPALWRAYQILSFLSHAYLWCDVQPPPQSLPAVLAVPWVRVSEQLGMPPVLCYCTYNLLNWRRLDPNGPVALGNIACLLNFLGGVDEVRG